MSDQAAESVGDKSAEISVEAAVPGNMEPTAPTTDAVVVDSAAKQAEDLIDSEKGHGDNADNGGESLLAAGNQLGKESDIADVSGDSSDFVMVSSTEEIDVTSAGDIVPTSAAADVTKDDVNVTDADGKKTASVDAVVDVNKASVESAETLAVIDESKAVSSTVIAGETETGRGNVTEVDTNVADVAERAASEVIAVVSEVKSNVTVSETGNIDTGVSDSGVGGTDVGTAGASEARPTGVGESIPVIAETDKITDTIIEALVDKSSVSAQAVSGVTVSAVSDDGVSKVPDDVSEPAGSELGVSEVGVTAVGVTQVGDVATTVSSISDTSTIETSVTKATTSVDDTGVHEAAASVSEVTATGVSEVTAASVDLLPAVSASDTEVSPGHKEISTTELPNEPVVVAAAAAAAVNIPAGLEVEVDTKAASKEAPVSHLEPTVVVEEQRTSKETLVSHLEPSKVEEEVSLKVAPLSHTEPGQVEEKVASKVALVSHPEPSKVEEEVSLKMAPVSHVEPGKVTEKVASKVALVSHPESSRIVEEQISSKEAPASLPEPADAATNGSHRKLIHIELTSSDDSPWNKSMEEPEYEFDDLDIRLAGSPVVTTAAAAAAAAGSGDRGDEVTGYEIGKSEPIDELAEEAVEQEFEEDFEEQLGTHQTDENDPELAYRDIAKFSIVQVAGDDSFGRKVIVFSACNMPPRAELDHQKLLGYLRHTLDQYVENDYTLVYFHHGLDRRNKPSFSWLRQAYGEFDRKYKKNLKALYVVHPTTFIKVLWNIFRPFISVKFGSKLMYLNYLHELAQHIQLDQIIIPPAVRNYDAEQLAKNKPRPVPVSIIHAPLPTQQFGVELEFIKRQNGGEIIPPVIQQCVAYLRTHGLETEGIFRRCASIKILRQVQDSFNQGVMVDFDKYGDVQIPAAIVKSFLRQLPEPILTYDLYDHIIHVQSMEMDERLPEMRRILTEELPAENYYVLKYVVQFLTEVFAHSDVNKMTVENLAIVFGPNLLWSKNEATLTLLGYVHSCAALLMSHYDQLFTK